MPMQMGPRFNFEALDIQKLKKNLRVKTTSRRKRHQDLSIDVDVDEIQPDHEAPHGPSSPEVIAAFSSRKSSPTIRTFNSQHLLPVNAVDLNHPRVASPTPRVSSPLPLDFNPNAPLPPLPPPGLKVDINRRPATSSQIDNMKSPTTFSYSSSEEKSNFDLRPPPPNPVTNTLDGLSDLLFSEGHLRTVLQDSALFARFTSFLNRYKPNTAPILIRYLDTQKAIKAVEYANALAETIPSIPGDHHSLVPCAAALVDARFKERCRRSFEILLADALPAFITNSLVKIVTESMVKEITGSQTPMMRDLLGGLAEVFCLTDPSVKDNPIVYASEEFYRTTQYGRDHVIGRNCRFLQGPRTNVQAVARLNQAINNGQEICETILNYRRDGTPFFNLVMIAPLLDNKGQVRYHIGAQVDISGLIEEGRSLESFERYLSNRRARQQKETDERQAGKRSTRVSNQSDFSDESEERHLNGNQKTLKKLKDLSEMFSHEEATVVSSHSRSNSLARGEDTASINSQQRRRPHTSHHSRPARRVLIDGSRSDDEEDERADTTWNLASYGPSGKLPGVYQSYLLIRPYPSLRIIFVSPALRIPGLLQSPFLSHIGAPGSVRDGLADAFSSGIAVTARISWISNSPKSRHSKLRYSTHPTSASVDHASNGVIHDPNASGDESVTERGQTRWISCTPLLGSDDRVGVWMVIMVDKPSNPASLPSRAGASSHATMDRPFVGPRVVDATIPPSAPMMNGGSSTIAGSDDGFTNGNVSALPAAGKITMVNGNGGSGGKQYSDFLRDSQVGRAAEGLKRSEVGPGSHRREESESVAESLAEELMGRLNTL